MMNNRKETTKSIRPIRKKKLCNKRVSKKNLWEFREDKKEKEKEKEKTKLREEDEDEEKIIRVFLNGVDDEKEYFHHGDIPTIKKTISISNIVQNKKNENYDYLYNIFEKDIDYYMNKEIKQVISSIFANGSLEKLRKMNKHNHFPMPITKIQKLFYENLEIGRIRSLQNGIAYFEATEDTIWDDKETEYDSLVSSNEDELNENNKLKDITKKKKKQIF